MTIMTVYVVISFLLCDHYFIRMTTLSYDHYHYHVTTATTTLPISHYLGEAPVKSEALRFYKDSMRLRELL